MCFYTQGSFCALSSVGERKQEKASLSLAFSELAATWSQVWPHKTGVKAGRGWHITKVKLTHNNSNTSMFYGVAVHYFMCSSQPCKVSAIILTPRIKELKLGAGVGVRGFGGMNSPSGSDRAWVEIHYAAFRFSALCNTIFIHFLTCSFACVVTLGANTRLVPTRCPALC